ncbi:MAG: PadR family transcriptional regulator [Gemmatimonadetes bacterium]|nr:PadR family transcriptional regulator [Gemmatimonadota bacterium]
MSPNAPRPAAILPVKPDVFMVLLVLLDGERHGYGIMQDAAERSGGEVRLQPGALYRMLKRLLEEGLVEETTCRQGERRRYYRITALGKHVAAAEARRMARLVDASRAHDLLDDAKYV